jgi:hypothetical protein
MAARLGVIQRKEERKNTTMRVRAPATA